MSHKKALPNDIDRFFAGKSVFFEEPSSGSQPVATPLPDVPPDESQPTATAAPTREPTRLQAKEGPPLPAQPQSSSPNALRSVTPAAPSSPMPPQTAGQEIGSEPKPQAVTPDVKGDVLTSWLQGVKLKDWQEVIENTETQNSALRLTSAERYVIEDVVNELRRQYGVKTSMNEIARLGLLLLMHDFKRNQKDSLLYQVKKA